MAILKSIGKNRKSTGKEGKTIEFIYPAPGAKAVCIAGSFNNWDPGSLPMRKDKEGTWKIKIKLAAGKHEYKYVVDGAWAHDARCPENIPNSLGSYNSVIGIS